MKFFFLIFCFIVPGYIFSQTWQSSFDSCLTYHDSQQYKKAIEWGDKALAIYEKEVAQKDTNYSEILHIQFQNHYFSGNYKKAEFYAKKDSAFSRNINTVRYASSCNDLGVAYLFQEKYYEAEHLFKTSMGIEKNTQGREKKYALVCTNLAYLFQLQGRYSEAESLYKQASKMYQKVLGKENLNYAILCNNLAFFYRELGRYSDAEPLYLEAKKIAEKLLGKEHTFYATCCNNIGDLCISQGRYEEAIDILTVAKQIRENKIGKENLEYAVCCNNLAYANQTMKNFSKAQELYLEAKNIYTNILGKEKPTYARSCANLARVYRDQGRFEEAELLYKEAIEISSKVFGKEHPDYALHSHMLGLLYNEQKRYTEAEALIKEAKELYAKTYGKLHPDYADVCQDLALVYQYQERYDDAEPLFLESIYIKNKELHINFKNLSESEKEKYVSKNVQSYFNHFQLFVQKRYLQNPAISTESYNLVLETKGMILQSTEKIKNRILGSNDENLKKLYLQWKKTKDTYTKAQNMTVQQRTEKKTNLDSIAKLCNTLEKELAVKSEDFAHTFTPKDITWKDIQKTLKKDQAAIEIIRTRNEDTISYMALVVRKNSQYPEIVVLPDGNKFEKEYLTNYRRSVTTKVSDKKSYDIFWKPIKEKLKGIKTVYFSPDGVYHQINLITLENPENQKYVFDEIQIISVTNTKDILEKYKFIGKNNYLIGNPKFNLGTDTKNNEKPADQRSIENLSQLEGAEKEVKEISVFLKNNTTLIGKEATEEYIKYIKNPRILHIATHGYFNKGKYQNNIHVMLNAGLLLAGVVDYDKMEIRPIDKEDGKLTAFEVMNMELDSTELVVLSACETGLGQASNEGVYGLQRAFKVAGAQTIIMSLWKVSDEATQLLMTEFYQNWQKKGMDKHKAFETAQKDLRKQYKEPYYWGAFVMIE